MYFGINVIKGLINGIMSIKNIFNENIIVVFCDVSVIKNKNKLKNSKKIRKNYKLFIYLENVKFFLLLDVCIIIKII